MAGAKVVATVVVSPIVLAVGGSLAPIPLRQALTLAAHRCARAGDTEVSCPKAKAIELENTATETILRVGNTAVRYDCVADGASSATIDALLGCEVDPWRSLFA